MENTNENDKLNKLESVIIFLLILFKYIISFNKKNIIVYIFLGACIGLTIIDIVNKKIQKEDIKQIIILGAISIMFVVFYQDVNFLISYVFSLMCLKKSEKSFVKAFFYSSLILYLSVIIMYLLGILEPNNMIRYVNGIVVTRFSLGFPHPNNVFLFLLPIVMSGYYLWSKNKIFYVVSFIIIWILYKLSLCRTGFYILIILLIMGLFKHIFEKQWFIKSVKFMMIIFAILSIYIASKFGNNIVNNVSSLFSGRPYYWKYFLDNNLLFTFWGENAKLGKYIDNFYIFLLAEYGIIGFTTYTYIYYKSVKYMEKNYTEILIIFIFLLYGLTETNVIIGSIQFMFAIQLKRIIESNEKILRNKCMGDIEIYGQNKYNNSIL